MNGYERFKAAIRLTEPDAVPAAPYMGNYGARLAGVPLDRYCRSGSLMAKAQLAAWEQCGQDALVAQSDQYYIAEGFGSGVRHHEDSIPTLSRPAVDRLEDVYRLALPDPRNDGRMPVYLEAIELLAAKVKGQAIVRAPGTGPFSLASHLLGTEQFLFLLGMLEAEPDPEAEKALRHLMDLATEALVRFAHAAIDAGADTVQAGDSLASLDMISPKMYREWAFPYEERFFGAVRDRAAEAGCGTILHICGNMTPVLPDMAATGATIIELDHKVDMRTAKELVGSKVCLMGNIEPSGILLQGSEAQVTDAASRVIRAAGAGGGFVLGSGCEVPPDAPLANIRALVRVAHGSRYPL